jgi:hypothetical protein
MSNLAQTEAFVSKALNPFVERLNPSKPNMSISNHFVSNQMPLQNAKQFAPSTARDGGTMRI